MELLKTIFYEPLYNGLIFLVSVIPGADLGIAVIILTLIVKFVLFPISHKSSRAQADMKAIEPEVRALQEKYKGNKEEIAKKTMELYRTRGVNPFSGCVSILIQFPIIIALYWVFFSGIKVPPETVASLPGHIEGAFLDKNILYSFVHMPEYLKINFLNFIDMTGKSILLAAIAGISQYVQMKGIFPDVGGFPKATGSWKDDLSRGMAFQMRYIMPVMVFVFAYTISAAVALYWSVSNIFTLIQEEMFRRRLRREEKK